MSRRLLCKALAILLFGMLAVPFALRADQKPGWPGKWELYVAPGAVVFESAPGTALERSETGFAGVAGVGLTDRVSVELLFADIDMAFSGPDGAGSDDTSLLWLDLLYRLPGRAGWQPFVLFGGGATRNDLGNSGLDKYDDTQFNAGVGLFYRLTDRFSLRADLRANYSNDQNDLQPFAFLGLTAFLGGSAGARRADTDGDGVADGRDRCPGTPVSRTVDGDGCEPDRDGDGVADDGCRRLFHEDCRPPAYVVVILSVALNQNCVVDRRYRLDAIEGKGGTRQPHYVGAGCLHRGGKHDCPDADYPQDSTGHSFALSSFGDTKSEPQ